MHHHTFLLRTATVLAAALAWSAATNTNAVEINYFTVSGYQAFIAMPANASAATPWVWYAPTRVGSTPNASNDWIFQHLVDQGIAVAGIDVGESYGSPAGRTVYSEFYDYATTQAGLGSQPGRRRYSSAKAFSSSSALAGSSLSTAESLLRRA